MDFPKTKMTINREMPEGVIAELKKYSCQEHGNNYHADCIACEVTQDIRIARQAIEAMRDYITELEEEVNCLTTRKFTNNCSTSGPKFNG